MTGQLSPAVTPETSDADTLRTIIILQQAALMTALEALETCRRALAQQQLASAMAARHEQELHA